MNKYPCIHETTISDYYEQLNAKYFHHKIFSDVPIVCKINVVYIKALLSIF